MSIEKDPAVAKRLDFVPDPARRAEYAKRFEAREPIKKLAPELGLTETRAAYCLRQEVVESRPDLRLDETSAAVTAAHGVGPYGDRAWLACRIGRSGHRLDQLLDKRGRGRGARLP